MNLALGQMERIGQRRGATTVLCCLIVSPHADRRDLLATAAANAGWDAVTCSDASDGWRAILDGAFQLTLLDIQDCSLAEQRELRELAQALVALTGNLLVVCGNPGDPLEELWVRQAGAWLYLPGVDDQSDVAMLCEEARTVTQRRMERELAPRINEQLVVSHQAVATCVSDRE